MFLHVFYSWLLAQIIHPFLMLIFIWGLDGSIDFAELWLVILLIFFLSMIFSFPGFLLGSLLLGPIVHASLTTAVKFLVWIIVTGILVLLSVWLLALIFANGEFDSTFLRLTFPAILSIWISCALRFKQFRKLVRNSDHKREILFMDKNELTHEN